jgi:hypothetical protein
MCGFLPIHLCLQAFQITTFLCCSFPICHIVAQQFLLNLRTSQLGILTNTNHVASSLPEIKAEDQALFISLPVEKGVTSKL